MLLCSWTLNILKWNPLIGDFEVALSKLTCSAETNSMHIVKSMQKLNQRSPATESFHQKLSVPPSGGCRIIFKFTKICMFSVTFRCFGSSWLSHVRHNNLSWMNLMRSGIWYIISAISFSLILLLLVPGKIEPLSQIFLEIQFFLWSTVARRRYFWNFVYISICLSPNWNVKLIIRNGAYVNV